MIVQDDRTAKINYQNNNNYHYYNNKLSKQCQLGFINPLGLMTLWKKSFEIEEKKKLQHFSCYVVNEVFSVWELLFICTCLQYSQLLFRTNRGQKDCQREETTRCRDISVITCVPGWQKAEYLLPLVPVHVEVKKKKRSFSSHKHISSINQSIMR